MSLDITDLLAYVVENNASDLHLCVGRPPTVRLHGELHPIPGFPVLTPDDTEALVKAITSPTHQARIAEVGTADFGFAFGDVARFRVSAFKQKGVYQAALRLIPSKLMTFEEIGLPPGIKDLLHKPRGLILVVGPTGCGKTTTLATMIDYINQNRDCHIVTIEDPIEYYHDHKKSIVTQREVGVDVPSFAEALVRVLRQDPDVILVGEMRDLATIEAAITAAETGHLVFATLHTTGAARTVDRVIGVFPVNQQEQIRMQLSVSIVAIISQLLLKRVDQPGRVAAFEIMISTPGIANLIREKKTHRITSSIQTGAKQGMKPLDDSLFELYSQGIISYEDMMSKAMEPEEIHQRLGEAG